MTKKCKLDNISAVIEQELNIYKKEIITKVKARTKKVASKCRKNIAKDSPKRTGNYSKGWAIEKEFENANGVRYRVRNKEHYRLTHLLENGHAIRGACDTWEEDVEDYRPRMPWEGTRVKARPHIRPNEEVAKIELTEGIKEDIKNSGKG